MLETDMIRFKLLFLLSVLSLPIVMRQMEESFVTISTEQSLADRDWEALNLVLQRRNHPELKYSSPDQKEYFISSAWDFELNGRAFREKGLEFWEKYPEDPRKFQWLYTAMHPRLCYVHYFLDARQGVEDLFHYDANKERITAPIDVQAEKAWVDRYSMLKAEFLTSEDTTENQKGWLRAFELEQDLQHAQFALARGLKEKLNRTLDGIIDLSNRYPTGLQAGPSDHSFMRNTPFFIAQKVLNHRSRYGVENDAITYLVSRMKESQNSEVRALAASEEYLIKLRKTTINMAFRTLDGQYVDLKKLKGKVVMIDFWEFGCLPCQLETPGMIAVYEKYHQRGLEIFGISLDDEANRAKFKSLVKKLNIPWSQNFEGKGYKNEYAVKLSIRAVPRHLIFDRSGLLIADLEGSKSRETYDAIIKAAIESN